MAYHPEVQHGVAEMTMGSRPSARSSKRSPSDWSNGVAAPRLADQDRGRAKYNAVETAWRIADRALEVSGGFGMFKKSEMERLFRDARAGRFHPANSSLAHELVGKLALGINPDDPQRWG